MNENRILQNLNRILEEKGFSYGPRKGELLETAWMLTN